MKRKLLAMFLVTAMLLTACGDAGEKTADVTPATEVADETAKSAEGDGGSWAIYWYLCGSDLESENGCGSADLQEMMQTTLPENVTVVIEAGGASEWKNDYMSSDALTRLTYTGNNLEVIDQLEQANMGDPDTLTDFLAFCNENYPADHKMVLFWDHGGGSTSGAANDENFDSDCLTLPELRQAFEATCEPSETEQPYDIIGFDACLMATIDVAGIFKDMGKYLVASEETEPGTGWSYNEWLKTFGENANVAPVEICKTICDTFYSACEQYDIAEKVTLSVTDLSKVSAVQEAYSAFGDEALVNVLNDTTFYATYDRSARKAQNYGGNTDKSGYSDMADLGDLAEKSKEIMPSTSAALQSALSDAIVYQVMGNHRQKASGLSCYYPYSYNTTLYKGYHKATATPSFDYYFQYLLKDSISQKGKEYIQALVNGAQLSEKETVGADELEDHKLKIIDGNTAELNIGAKAASLLSSVCYQLAVIDDDTILYLGTNDNLSCDWDNGVFRDNFDGTWGSIDGNLVYMEVTDSTDDYTIFTIPIKLNKKECFLDCSLDNSTGETAILGVKSGIENGMSAKDYRKLEVGDEITTMFCTGSVSEDTFDFVDIDTIAVKEDTTFSMTDLGDATYGLAFEMSTAEGKDYTSAVEIFKVENNAMKYIS
ncbi:MAG: clostripain-related cysteine peptidase [Eubacterium sp.]|nr:clostripain-related cysteine peptidase [Eubacterium sp.]